MLQIPTITETKSIPVKNTIIESEIGETLVRSYNITTKEAIQIEQPTTLHPVFSLIKGSLIIPNGIYEKEYLFEDGTSYYLSSKEIQINTLGAIRGQSRIRVVFPGDKMYKKWPGIENGTLIWPVNVLNTPIAMQPKITYSKALSNRWSPESFDKQFIYNGKSGSTLKFTYREFNSGYARPAFNQDLNYDLTEGKIIGFKGARIEVIDTTNTSIKYKVLEPFPIL
ncbi:hypothetical protein OAG73_01820 [bacterium]|nr:hypothetical protein [bacterium]